MVSNLSAINMYMVKSPNMCTYARHHLYYRQWKVLNNQDLKKVIKKLGNSSKKRTHMIFHCYLFYRFDFLFPKSTVFVQL